MNKRILAIANGELTYSSGKPCKAGHISERYSSNGMCLACLKIQHEARKDVVRLNKIKRNTALFDQLQEAKVMVRGAELHVVTQLCEILQFSDHLTKDSVAAFIAMQHASCPTPRSLTKDVLISQVGCVFDGEKLCNWDALPIAQDEKDGLFYLTHNGQRYEGSEVMKVLRGLRLSVHPT